MAAGTLFMYLASLLVQSETSDLVSRMKSLGLRFALLVESQAIEESPAWSPDGRFLAVHLEGKWSKLDTRSLTLRMGTWQDRKTIAIPHPPPPLQGVAETEVRAWQPTTRFDPHRLTTKTGVTIELAPEDLGTVFRVTSQDREPEILWRTTLENCHSLALSPDETVVAFLCELNGLVVFAVPP